MRIVCLQWKNFLRMNVKNWDLFFPGLKNPIEPFDSTILSLIKSELLNVLSPPPVVPDKQPVQILLPFKGQKSADVLRKQLSNRIGTPLQPIYMSRKLGDVLSVKEQKPSLINQHSAVYKFLCPLCDAEIIHRPHNSTSFSENWRTLSQFFIHLQTFSILDLLT